MPPHRADGAPRARDDRGLAMRSLLFAPGDDARKMAKALAGEADVVICDLEDSVAPPNKAKARAETLAFLQANRAQAHRLFVRVNALDSGLVDDDLAAIIPGAPACVVLPKSLGGASVQALGARLAVHEAINGFADGATKILAIATESAAALFGMGTYAGCSARLIGLAWGAEDLGADIGVERRRDSDGRYTDVFRHARTMTLLGAVAAGVAPIDAVLADFRDLEALKRESVDANSDGFTAKMAIHPAQVPAINAAFAPSEAALAHARAVLAAFEGAGVASLGGQMLDRPHFENAKKILARAGGGAAR